MTSILIAGATGLIAGQIAYDVIPKYDVKLLVRGNDPLSRLYMTLARYGAGVQATQSHIIEGDLSSSISDHFDIVINCAAIATFNHPRTHEVNVDHTMQFISQFPITTHIVQFGTGFSCGQHKSNSVITTATPPGVPFNAYSKSKRDLARLVEPLRNVTLVSPAIVIGHSEIGCPTPSLFWVFAMIARHLKAFTVDLHQTVDVVPVDYVSKVVQQIMLLTGTSRGGVYFPAAGDQGCTWGEIMDHFPKWDASKYQRLNVASLNTIVDTLDMTQTDRSIMHAMVKAYGPFGRLGYKFTNNTMITPPKYTDYIDKCIAHTNHLTVQEMWWPELNRY
jgi:nucleoside-diphosphate-sugar epimerase